MLIWTKRMASPITLCSNVKVLSATGNTVLTHPRSRDIPMRLMSEQSRLLERMVEDTLQWQPSAKLWICQLHQHVKTLPKFRIKRFYLWWSSWLVIKWWVTLWVWVREQNANDGGECGVSIDGTWQEGGQEQWCGDCDLHSIARSALMLRWCVTTVHNASSGKRKQMILDIKNGRRHTTAR